MIFLSSLLESELYREEDGHTDCQDKSQYKTKQKSILEFSLDEPENCVSFKETLDQIENKNNTFSSSKGCSSSLSLESFHPSSEVLPKPHWLKRRFQEQHQEGFRQTQELVQHHKLHTVCQEAACPNIQECWSKGHATVMILGKVCTRSCTFCNIAKGKPEKIMEEEPEETAKMVQKMALHHVVVTSVDRDDLPDGGAEHFYKTITAIRHYNPTTTIEILTPDFLGKPGALELVLSGKPDVFNHNVETVPRLYRTVRPKARYFHSLYILKQAKMLYPDVFTKSGLMTGLGETEGEIHEVMRDLRAADVDFLTIGQYLQPSPRHHPVLSYYTPEQFEALEKRAYRQGFLQVSSSPWTRSSYHAGENFRALQEKRQKKQA